MDRVSKKEKKYWEKEFYITPHVLSLVNYCHYMKSLAKLIGCAPKIPSIFKDPKFHIKMWFCPQFAAQYRLDGPHADPQTAKNFINTFPRSFSNKKLAKLLLIRWIGMVLPVGIFKPRPLEFVKCDVNDQVDGQKPQEEWVEDYGMDNTTYSTSGSKS